MREQLEVLVEDIADRLQNEAKTSTGNYETYYCRCSNCNYKGRLVKCEWDV